MITLISIELYKIAHKWRSYIGFIAITALILIIQTAIYIEGDKYLDFLTRSFKDTFLMVGNFLNGYLIAQVVLGGLLVHIPFLITLVTGDLLAGEATAGTYRMLLTRPVSRTKILLAKYLSGQIYILAMIVWLAILSLGLGLLIFGTGELIVVRNEIVILAKNDIVWRYVLAYAFAFISMGTVASLSFLFSSLVENSIGPIISTMAIIIVFLIISSIDVSFFRTIKPYLFTNYMLGWRLFFDQTIDYEEAIRSAAVLLGHSVVFFSATLIIFRRKDILS